jgi:predicted transposase/invertase (TIGR01784 family)
MEEIAQRNAGVRKAVERYKQLTADERERMIAEAVEHQRRIKAGQLKYAQNEGRAKGREEGRKEGREEGRRENAHRMKADGMDATLIAKYTGLSVEEIAKL